MAEALGVVGGALDGGAPLIVVLRVVIIIVIVRSFFSSHRLFEKGYINILSERIHNTQHTPCSDATVPFIAGASAAPARRTPYDAAHASCHRARPAPFVARRTAARPRHIRQHWQ